MTEEDIELRLVIDRGTHRFLRAGVVLADRRRPDMSTIKEYDVLKQIKGILLEARWQTRDRALKLLGTAGFSGLEIIALNDLLDRFGSLASADAEHHCERHWSHVMTTDRLRQLVVQIAQPTEVCDAFFVIVNELVDDNSGCRQACLSMGLQSAPASTPTEPPTLWKRFHARVRSIASR